MPNVNNNEISLLKRYFEIKNIPPNLRVEHYKRWETQAFEYISLPKKTAEIIRLFE